MSDLPEKNNDNKPKSIFPQNKLFLPMIIGIIAIVIITAMTFKFTHNDNVSTMPTATPTVASDNGGKEYEPKFNKNVDETFTSSDGFFTISKQDIQFNENSEKINNNIMYEFIDGKLYYSTTGSSSCPPSVSDVSESDGNILNITIKSYGNQKCTSDLMSISQVIQKSDGTALTKDYTINIVNS